MATRARILADYVSSGVTAAEFDFLDTTSGTPGSGNFLRGDKTWAEAGGGSWTFIGTSVASDSAPLAQTGLDSSSYDMYAILFSDIIPATDGAEFKMRMGDSSGIDSGATDYDWHCANLFDSSATYGAQVSSGADYIKLNPNVGSAATEGFSGMLYLSSPATSSVGPMVYGTHFGIVNSGVSQGGPIFGRRISAIDLDRIQAFFSSGNITSGRMSVYGIAHA